jgi:hypothetical protein
VFDSSPFLSLFWLTDAVLGSSQEVLPLPCLVICLPGVEIGDIVQSVDNAFLWNDCDNQTVHYHGEINWF